MTRRQRKRLRTSWKFRLALQHGFMQLFDLKLLLSDSGAVLKMLAEGLQGVAQKLEWGIGG